MPSNQLPQGMGGLNREGVGEIKAEFILSELCSQIHIPLWQFVLFPVYAITRFKKNNKEEARLLDKVFM